MPAIRAAAGIAPGTLRGAQVSDRITQRTHDAIARAHGRLWDSTPPDTWQARRWAAQARRAGWAPTLAWDDIDDPAETPTGWRRSDVTLRHRADWEADVADLVAVGYSRDAAIKAAAAAAGVDVCSVQRTLARGEAVA